MQKVRSIGVGVLAVRHFDLADGLLCRNWSLPPVMYELPDAYRLGRDATRLSLFQACFYLAQVRFKVVCCLNVLSSHTEGGRWFPASSAVLHQGSRTIPARC